MKKILTPNALLKPSATKGIVLFQLLCFFLLWIASPFQVLPKPYEVWDALGRLFSEFSLAREIDASLHLNLEALAITTLIGLLFSYLSVVPFFRPIATLLSKGRFLSLVGFSFVFTLMLGGGHTLKLALLVLGMSVFFITSMASVVQEIPKEKYDYARTLRMSEWRIVWEVVILGTIDRAFEVLRQNAAIGWMMLTMVEGISRSEGGIGVLLLTQQKHFNIASVFAIQLLVVSIGILQDQAIAALRKFFCPWSVLGLERR